MYVIRRDVDSYTHRVGRTARAGKLGEAISLVATDEERKFFKQILFTYGGSSDVAKQGVSGAILRAMASSQTLNYLSNIAHKGVYILHGGKDEEVDARLEEAVRVHERARPDDEADHDRLAGADGLREVAEEERAERPDEQGLSVHDCPERAKSDGPQALLPRQYAEVAGQIRKLAELFGKAVSVPVH